MTETNIPVPTTYSSHRRPAPIGIDLAEGGYLITYEVGLGVTPGEKRAVATTEERVIEYVKAWLDRCNEYFEERDRCLP